MPALGQVLNMDKIEVVDGVSLRCRECSAEWTKSGKNAAQVFNHECKREVTSDEDGRKI